MPKKKTLILFTMVLAVVALFAATEVMAVEQLQCPPSNCEGCPELPIACQAGSALSLEVLGIDGEFPLIITSSIDPNYGKYGCGGTPCYVWGYTGQQLKNPDNQILMSLRDCCPNCIKVWEVGVEDIRHTPDIIPPCEIDKTTKLGGSCTDFMLRIPFDFSSSQKKPFYITTSIAGTDRVSVLVKSKKHAYPCVNPGYDEEHPCAYRGGIPGPGCSGLQREVIVNPSVEEQICEYVKFCLVKENPATLCADRIHASENTNLTCEWIIANTPALDPTALETFFYQDGQKVAKFLSPSKTACRIRCMKFKEKPVDGDDNAICLTLGGVPFCF